MTRWCVSRRISPSRYPLVDGQGNFGNIDGDNPAAYRYTEARMTEVARLLLEGIDEDAVDFRPNYDGSTRGAVGSARRVPEPACQRLAGHRGRHGDLDPAAQRGRALRRRAAPDRQADTRRSRSLLKYVQGSGFSDRRHRRRSAGAIAEAYATGRGCVPRARASGTQEEGARGTWVVVVTEIPWLVQKSRLIERIAELLNEKKLPSGRPTSATSRPKTSASSSSRSRATSIPS